MSMVLVAPRVPPLVHMQQIGRGGTRRKAERKKATATLTNHGCCSFSFVSLFVLQISHFSLLLLISRFPSLGAPLLRRLVVGAAAAAAELLRLL